MTYDLLRRNLIARFDTNEIRTLCFDLGIDYDNIEGVSKPDKCRELIAHLHRRDLIQELISWCERERPTVNWRSLIGPLNEPLDSSSAPSSVSQQVTKTVVSPKTRPYLFDAYISFTKADESRLLEIIPHLVAKAVRIAIAGEIDLPGEFRVENVERGLENARRTVVLLSPAYMMDSWAGFTGILAQTMAVEEQSARLIPVILQPVDLPLRLRAITAIDLHDQTVTSVKLERLAQILKSPLRIRG